MQLNELLDAQQKWTDKKDAMQKSILGVDAAVQIRQGELAQLQAQRNQALRSEKENILADLHVPTAVQASLYSYTPRKAIVEESLLNHIFLENFAAQAKLDHAVKYNQYVADHTAELNRVREINALLGLAEDSDLTQYQPMAVSDKPKSLPERFAAISAFFAKTQEWRLFKQALKPYADGKRPKTNPLDSFFADTDYVRLSIQDTQLLLFPYCIVKCESKKPMWVYSYDQAVLTLSHTEQTGDFRVLPPHAELISERHTYLNQDGSVDRRHKINPIIKTVRYSTATIFCAKETVKLLFDSLAEATAFEEAFTAYQRFLTDGTYRNIYKTVIRSEDITAFHAAVARCEQERAAPHRRREKAHGSGSHRC